MNVVDTIAPAIGNLTYTEVIPHYTDSNFTFTIDDGGILDDQFLVYQRVYAVGFSNILYGERNWHRMDVTNATNATIPGDTLYNYWVSVRFYLFATDQAG